MSLSGRTRAGLAVVACAAVGAAGGIAGSAAAPSRHKARTAAGRARLFHDAPGVGRGDRAVHAEAVVLDKAGTAYITLTLDNGVVKSVSGNDVTITEGTSSVPYKDVTVTIPDGATVLRDGATATLADLKAGDHVRVAQSSDGTTVFAADATWRPDRWGGPRGADGDGPPPGGAGF